MGHLTLTPTSAPREFQANQSVRVKVLSLLAVLIMLLLQRGDPYQCIWGSVEHNAAHQRKEALFQRSISSAATKDFMLSVNLHSDGGDSK